MPKYHSSAFWLYGVFIGLAITKAIESGVGVLLSTDPTSFATYAAAARMVVFVFLAIRFYLGSATYFAAFYDRDEPPENPGLLAKAYREDFLSGVFHFLWFVAAALLINEQSAKYGHLAFIICVAVILAYDLVWWLLITRGTSRVKMVAPWALANAFAGMAAAVVYFILYFQSGPLKAETWALLPIFLHSCADLVWLWLDKHPLQKLFGDDPSLPDARGGQRQGIEVPG